jgi:Lrp/AsnC family transcriptional regulator for asnA, asnC and gidA
VASSYEPSEVGGGPPPLDDVDKLIVKQLQEDGRRPYGAIAAAVGMSEAATRKRVQRLVDGGVVQVVGVTNPLQVGFHRQALVGIRADGDLGLIAEKLADIEEVDYVVICAGSFDLVVELVATGDDHLLSIMNQRIRSIAGVRETETFIYLRLVKQTYSWGTR